MPHGRRWRDLGVLLIGGMMGGIMSHAALTCIGAAHAQQDEATRKQNKEKHSQVVKAGVFQLVDEEGT